MEPDALPVWAERHAAMLLADLGPRWQHVRGVGRQARRVGQALDEDDRPYLVAAAWLHDIGYAPMLAATAFHPLDDARHIRSLGSGAAGSAGRPLLTSRSRPASRRRQRTEERIWAAGAPD